MKNQTKKFWAWRNQADESGSAGRELELYGTIAEQSWFDDDITPAMFKEELFSGTGPITVWINLCDREPKREQEVMELVERHIRQFFRLYARN